MAGYTIGSEKGQRIADNLKVGETYSASDGSIWTKQANGAISVVTKNGGYTANAYQSSVPNASDTSAKYFNDAAKSISDSLQQVKDVNSNTNALAIEEAQKNRDWQEQMSNTSHQREVADLKAAGLNPVLSATGGATTPSGSQASISDASGHISSLLGSAIAGLVSIANTQANNATSLQMNAQSLDLQKILGLAGLDLQKYGIDKGYAQTVMTNQTALSVANINKQIAELNNSEQWNRLIKQGEIDISKINTQADMDMLKSALDFDGSVPTGDFVQLAFTVPVLLARGIIDDKLAAQLLANGNSHNTGEGNRNYSSKDLYR